MSDNIMIVTIICVTIVAITLGLPTIVLIATYTRDKLNLKNKTSIKDLVDTETAITVEDKDSKKWGCRISIKKYANVASLFLVIYVIF